MKNNNKSLFFLPYHRCIYFLGGVVCLCVIIAVLIFVIKSRSNNDNGGGGGSEMSDVRGSPASPHYADPNSVNGKHLSLYSYCLHIYDLYVRHTRQTHTHATPNRKSLVTAGMSEGVYAAPLPDGGTYASPVPNAQGYNSSAGTYTGASLSDQSGDYVDLTVAGGSDSTYGNLEQKKDYLPDNTVYQAGGAPDVRPAAATPAEGW
jgi:hypothetical protein